MNEDTNNKENGKYFVNSDLVLPPAAKTSSAGSKALSIIIEPQQIQMAEKPFVVHDNPENMRQIQVDTVRENGRIVRIKIACPCGQTADINVQYEN